MKQNIFYTPQDYCNSRLSKIRKALIIHPGAMGDCILTLRLAEFLKQKLRINFLEFAGNIDYISFFQGRTCIDKVTSLEKLHLSRLFAEPAEFTVDEDDHLISDLAGYDWVLSFLGDKNSHFEQNLIYILCHTNSPEFVTLSAKAPKDFNGHISQFHIDEFVQDKKAAIETYSELDMWDVNLKTPAICPSREDMARAVEIFRTARITRSFDDKLVMIAPGSGSIHKNWYLSNFTNLAEKLIFHNYRIVYILGTAELDRLAANEIDQLHKTGSVLMPTNVDELCALLSIANIYIGNDSGPAHLSAGLGNKTFTIFGSTSINRYQPGGPYSYSIRESQNSFISSDQDSVDRVCDFVLRSIKNNYPNWDVAI